MIGDVNPRIFSQEEINVALTAREKKIEQCGIRIGDRVRFPDDSIHVVERFDNSFTDQSGISVFTTDNLYIDIRLIKGVV